jgi:WD40 repeat protein
MSRVLLACLAFCTLGLFAATHAEEKPHPGYRVLGCDKGKVTILAADGKTVEWQVPCKVTAHDLQLLANGNLLMPTSNTTIVEMTPDKKTVWEYTSQSKAGYTGKIEIHAFQRLANGRTMIAESGNGRIIEVDAGGKIVHEMPLTRDRVSSHSDTRQVRKLESGNYLVACEADGKVREYDKDGKIVWSYSIDLGDRKASPGHGVEGHGTSVYSAVRLANGNTLIGGGNNNRVLEVDPAGKIVWSVDQKELPGITLAWVTTVQALPNGNVIIGNCHAGPDNPQLIEVTRDKKVVWSLKNFDIFGNSLAVGQVLDVPGVVR